VIATAIISLLQKYVTDVVTHFKGKIYAWDVVNEVVSDDDGPTAPYRDSNWYQAAGGADYIDWAFEAARAADPDVQLFINDYSTELAGKRGRLVSVVEDHRPNYPLLYDADRNPKPAFFAITDPNYVI